MVGAMALARRHLATLASPTSSCRPDVYLGTMTFGWNQSSLPVGEEVATQMVGKFLGIGGVEIDTARIYSGGKTEDILGKVLRNLSSDKRFKLTTKVHPSQPGGLSAHGIRTQLEASLKALGRERVDALYLHQPDPENDLEESLACVSQLVAEGKVGMIGLSNYSAIETERCLELCKAHGWASPSVVQALYNPLNRWAEDELVPVLRRHSVRFVAYNPLAAGLLTGKHNLGGDVLSGRFKDNPNYLPRFYTEANFTALERIRATCEQHGLGLVPATYAWMLCHSALDAAHGDGLLLGASSIEQLEENLSACVQAEPLAGAVREAFDGAWKVCQDRAFPFWRSYSRDQPGREALHQGASYDAKVGK